MVVDPHAGATPTPVISHMTLECNRVFGRGSTDGIVVARSPERHVRFSDIATRCASGMRRLHC